MQKIEDLIRKYNSGQCSAEEKIWLEQWYQSFDWDTKSENIPANQIEKWKEEAWLAFQNKKMDLGPEITIPLQPAKSTSFRWLHYAAAVVIIAALSGMAFFYFSWPSKQIIATNNTIKNKDVDEQVLPGTSKAQLLMADGSTISLDSAHYMQLREKDGTQINKQAEQLIYNTEAASLQDKVLFNLLSTPRGGEYQLVLHDGSKVWLNAASSLRFPTRFQGKERTVYLQGEAYFEIVSNAKMPFRVDLGDDMSVEVTGTQFNIMGYDDENEIRTTLKEGRVKVVRQNKTVLLSPLKQAIIKKTDNHITVSDADVPKALAWKNGMIEFDEDDLPYIMRQLSRWYDVDVSFTGDIPKGTYKGEISRHAPLAEVLEILSMAGVQFKQEGKKLIVTDG